MLDILNMWASWQQPGQQAFRLVNNPVKGKNHVKKNITRTTVSSLLKVLLNGEL